MTDMKRFQRGGRRSAALPAVLFAGGLLVWSGAAMAAATPESFAELAQKVTPAVVNIASAQDVEVGDGAVPGLPFELPPGSPFERFFKQFRDGENAPSRGARRRVVGVGSGFIVDPAGYIVTNNHVVERAREITVRLDDETSYPAKLIGTDPLTDLALLKIEAGKALSAVEFGDSDRARVGDWVLAVGNPFGLGGSVTAGIISARGRNIESGPYDDFLQIDAPINRGNSGGPLFTLDGKVVGVNTAIFSPNGGSVGIGFAIPANMAKSVVAQLKENGKVERGWLGVNIQTVTPEIASSLGLERPAGAIVSSVMAGSPAERAGLKQGDVIVKFAGEPVRDARELARSVALKPAGSEVTLTVWRQQRETTLSVVTGELPAQQQLAAGDPGSAGDAPHYSKTLEADLAPLTPRWRAELGLAKEVDGVVVVRVNQGQAFEQGLRQGDVIRKVGGEAVGSPGEIDGLLAKTKSGAQGAVLLLVNRGGRDIFLGLKLGVA